MTRVTTITEYETDTAYYISAVSTDGFSGNIVYQNDEATVTLFNPENSEMSVTSEHPDDAFAQLIAYFFPEEID